MRPGCGRRGCRRGRSDLRSLRDLRRLFRQRRHDNRNRFYVDLTAASTAEWETEENEMSAELHNLHIDEQIRLVEDLWDSIAAEQEGLHLTKEQRAELDRRLDSYEADGNQGQLLADAIADIRKRL